MQERIAVVGLGYVGLPTDLAFARRFPNTASATIGAVLRPESVVVHESTVHPGVRSDVQYWSL